MQTVSWPPSVAHQALWCAPVCRLPDTCRCRRALSCITQMDREELIAMQEALIKDPAGAKTVWDEKWEVMVGERDVTAANTWAFFLSSYQARSRCDIFYGEDGSVVLPNGEQATSAKMKDLAQSVAVVHALVSHQPTQLRTPTL